MKTPHAKCAAAIRAELKKAYPDLIFRCTSECFAGGDAVRVVYVDQPWERHKEIQDLLAKYEYGHFDGMTDCYYMSNRREDIPQVRFLNVDNDMSDAKRQEIYDRVRAKMEGGQDLPERYEDAHYKDLQGQWVSTWVWRGFTGAVAI